MKNVFLNILAGGLVVYSGIHASTGQQISLNGLAQNLNQSISQENLLELQAEALYNAVERNDQASVSILLCLGANPAFSITMSDESDVESEVDEFGNRLEQLVQEPQEYRISLLEYALQRQSFDVAKELMKNEHVDINVTFGDGDSLLHYAVKLNDVEMVKILLERGIDVNIINEENGLFPLHIACEKARIPGYVDRVIETLLAAGADVNAYAPGRKTPLRYAVEHDNEGLVTMLLEHNADPTTRNGDGLSPVHCAINKKATHLLRLFLTIGEHKNNVLTACNHLGQTPLFTALMHYINQQTGKRDNSMVLRLLEYGASLEDKIMNSQSIKDFIGQYCAQSSQKFAPTELAFLESLVDRK